MPFAPVAKQQAGCSVNGVSSHGVTRLLKLACYEHLGGTPSMSPINESIQSRSDGGGGGWLGRALVVLFVWMVIALVGYYLVSMLLHGNSNAGPQPPGKGPGNVPARQGGAAGNQAPEDPSVPPAEVAQGTTVELGVAFGTEKERWLKTAVEAFAKSPAGKSIHVNLYGMGSLESAHAILEGEKGEKRIHVWSPASSLYKETFLLEWQLSHTGNPIVKEETLAMSPMVFVMWKDRYDAFTAKFGEVNFDTISSALDSEGGWGGIANQTEWGLFKFGHTHPNQSNSGLMTLVLMAYDFHKKVRNLTIGDIVDPKFQAWLTKFERGVSGKTNSTGNLMREMVLKGPSAYDAVMVYEAVAIDYLKNAEGRWGELKVVYPKHNIWNDNPYYILKTDWTRPEHQKAAETFLSFLMSSDIQKKSLDHGFRPGNTDVPVLFPESPFMKFEKYGLKVKLPTAGELPPPEVINNLQQTWQRSAGP
jgi:hypothetical protein